MKVEWTDSADKHGIPRDETLWAVTHADVMMQWPPARPGRHTVPTLIVGPSRYGTLEVLVEVTDTTVVIFHSMRLRATTEQRINQEGGQT